jgi:hypothetical protein
MTKIDYFNTNSLLIDTPIGTQYGGVSAWQGIRYLGSDTYLICGTTNPNPNTGNGLIYLGEINCNNGVQFIQNVPNSLGTSVYGPNYDFETGIYTFVGSYIDYSLNINGYIYTGNLDADSLSNPNNYLYPSVNSEYNTTFLHSNSNGLIIGNSGNNFSNKTISYIYDITNLSQIKKEIKFPNSKTTTTYGIWSNGNSSYTIVGGYSNDEISIDKIYFKNGVLNPIGNAFIVDYNSITNTFSNWTTIVFSDMNATLETHFQGIYGNEDGTYSLNADVLNLKENIFPQGYFLTISRNSKNEFEYNLNNWIKIQYNKFGITTSNSVANNKVVGLFIGKENVSFQCEILNEIAISKYNLLYDTVKNNERILFNNTFLDNNLINYNNGKFTFLESGTYFVSFNIYIENTTLPAVIFEVKYSIDSKTNKFNVVQKGIDEIGTQTAHSLVIPCSFTSKFSINDTLEIINKSGDVIYLISNYFKNSVNAIISITKLL